MSDDIEHDFRISIPLTTESLAELISQNVDNNDELLKLIVRLDELVVDWDFTLALADHFEKLRHEFFTEFPEVAQEEAAVRGLIDENEE